jgi:hypothetical protein
MAPRRRFVGNNRLLATLPGTERQDGVRLSLGDSAGVTEWLNVHEIGFCGAIQHITRHGRGYRKIARNIKDLIAQVAGMRSAQFAIAFDIPFLQ